MLSDVAVNGGLKVDDRAKDATADTLEVRAEKKPSTALSQDAEVGMKCKTHGGCRTSQACTFRCLLAAQLSRTTWISQPAGTPASIVLRQQMNSDDDDAACSGPGCRQMHSVTPSGNLQYLMIFI